MSVCTYYYQFSIAHCLFNSRLKPFLFCKSILLRPIFFFVITDYMIPPGYNCYF